MGQRQLEEKLTKVLAKKIESEIEVLYVMVEIRKLLDLTGYDSPHVRMFCDWAAHVELTRRQDGAIDLLKEIDAEVTSFIETKKPRREEPKHLRFTVFKDGMTDVLTHFKLPKRVVENRAE